MVIHDNTGYIIMFIKLGKYEIHMMLANNVSYTCTTELLTHPFAS